MSILKKLSVVTAGAAIVAVALAADPAQAVTLYTNRAEFEVATIGLTNIDFEGLAPSGGFSYYGTPNGLTQAGATFIAPAYSGNFLAVTDPNYGPEFYDWGSGAVLIGYSFYNDIINVINVTLPFGVTAVGSDIMSILPHASPFNVTLSTGESFIVPSFNYPNRAFVGFTSSTPISTINFKPITSPNTSADLELDNFTFGQANAVPVPDPGFSPVLSLLTLGVWVATAQFKRKVRKPKFSGSALFNK